MTDYYHAHPDGRTCDWCEPVGWVLPDGSACVDTQNSGPIEKPTPEPDVVHMPSHYTQLPVECIDVTEHFGFCLGNAIKYIWRADHKGKPIEDLKKSIWYIEREIARREKEQ